MRRSIQLLLGGCVAILGLSCGDQAPSPRASSYYPAYQYPNEDFKDKVETNTQVKPSDLELTFVDSKGDPVDLKRYRDKKNVVLVVMRGYPGFVCPNCSAQTSRLISNYREFARRDAEVLVVFPGPTEHLSEFVGSSRRQASNAEVPFPILLDQGFVAVDRLGIRGDLAKPSTYIIDKHGQVRFAYVGAYSADRPSLKALLEKLDGISKS